MPKDYPDVNMDNYDTDELSKVKKLERMFESARDARKSKMPRWRRNEELVEGKFLKPFNYPDSNLIY